MSNKKRIALILSVFFITPLFGFLISTVQAAIISPEGTSGLAQGYGIFIGFLGGFVGLLLGPFVSFILRKKTDGFLSLLGYIIPSSISLLYLLLLPLLA